MKSIKKFIPKQVKLAYRSCVQPVKSRVLPDELRRQIDVRDIHYVNLCSGPVMLEDYINVDIAPCADVVLDLEKKLLPFPDNSVRVLVCISAINYFTKERAAKIIEDVFRVMKPGGIVRFAVQDLRILAEKLVSADHAFYYQKLDNGEDRFPGETMADKFNHFFNGFATQEYKHCRYVYDAPTLKMMLEKVGFSSVEQRAFRDSRIPGIDKIDNRAEQMFFMEALKEDDRPLAEQARLLWAAGRHEEAWSKMLYALRINPANKALVADALTMMEGRARPDNQNKLIDEYIKHSKDALSFDKRAQIKLNVQSMQERRQVLERSIAFNNPVMEDRVHLDAAMGWLKNAYDNSKDNGVPAVYDAMAKEWYTSYPETTGYIIPTFLVYARLSKNDYYAQAARKMGDWELNIQLPNGGAGEAVGVYAPHPRVFNTGQVMLGWLALYQDTKEARYLEGLKKAAGFLIKNLEADGAWTKNTFQGSKSYHSRVAWALLELYGLTKDAAYQHAAEKAVVWIMRQAQPNGWFKENGFGNRYASTHLIAYTYVGLLKICALHNARLPYDKIMAILRVAADQLIQINGKKPFMFHESYGRNWQGHETFSCMTGNIQIAYFLKGFGTMAKDKRIAQAGDDMIGQIKAKQISNKVGDINMAGGLWGSDPVGGAYAPYQIPNWGVKFFADALLQRMIPPDALYCIG